MSVYSSAPPSLAPMDTFRQYLDRDDPHLQRCRDCERRFFPPRVLCPACGSTTVEWTPIGDTAVVYSTTTVRRRPDRGGDYDVSIVELDGGARMMSTVVGIEPGDVRIGMSVTPMVDAAGETRRIVFASAEETS